MVPKARRALRRQPPATTRHLPGLRRSRPLPGSREYGAALEHFHGAMRSCASRFRVPRRLWIALPEANPRAPHETFEDRVREREGSFDRQLRVAPHLWD